MNKIYSFFATAILLLSFNFSNSQITSNLNYSIIGNLTNDSIEICQGDSVQLISGFPNLDFINSNFNNSSLDSGWTTNITPIWSNPCPLLTLPANGIVCWLGANVYPREMITNSINTAIGNCWIEWDMKYGANIGGSTNCESPDLPNEGVHLMYSTTGGSSWTQFPGIDLAPSGVYGNTNYINGSGGYWTPASGNIATGPYYTWNHFYTALPLAAISPSTKIKWYQDIASGDICDHWGIDNFKFSCHPSSPPFVWPGGGYSITVSPNTTQWFVASKLDTTQSPAVTIYDSVLIFVHPVPQTPVIFNLADSLYSSSSSGNQWYLNTLPIIGATSSYYKAVLDGNYQVVVSNVFECFSDTSNTLAIVGVGINETSLNVEFFLHPNPASEYFNIQTKDKISKVQIYDISGKSIKSFTNDCPTMNYNIKDFDKGLYFVKIYSGKRLSVVKLIIL